MAALPIAEHAFLSNQRSAALVDRQGCIDWACLPRFDAAACFAALLGTPQHGHWTIAPQGGLRRTTQHYLRDSMVAVTEFDSEDGRVRLFDFMPLSRPEAIIRIVEGIQGSVPMQLECAARLEYGAQPPRLEPCDFGWRMHGETQLLQLAAPIAVSADAGTLAARFRIDAGARAGFVLLHPDATEHALPAPERALRDCIHYWQHWATRCTYDGPYRDNVVRSLLTLKAMIYAPTGAILAAPTLGLPEALGGERNWDYRYCWIRDASFMLYALLGNGYLAEARQWRDCLVRMTDSYPEQLRPLYRIDGGPCYGEWAAPWLPGYRDSRPVRIGNDAAGQVQLDTYGELMDVLYVAQESGLDVPEEAWETQLRLMADLSRRWQQPDNGIWEVRGPPRHFVHSKAMAWVAFDRAIAKARRLNRPAPLAHWQAQREAIRDEIYRHGFDARRGCFRQHYATDELDASLLLLPLLGFIAADHPHMRGTVAAIRRELGTPDGLLRRYRSSSAVDGLEGEEGAFLPCAFWLVDCLALDGQLDEAQALFETLLRRGSPLGLYSEEWDSERGEMLGNFPQSLTHVGLINSARILSDCAHWGTLPAAALRPEHHAALQAGRRKQPGRCADSP